MDYRPEEINRTRSCFRCEKLNTNAEMFKCEFKFFVNNQKLCSNPSEKSIPVDT